MLPMYVVYLPDEWEVDQNRVKMYDTLGEGAFGMVYAGSLSDAGKQTAVAIKVDARYLYKLKLQYTEGSLKFLFRR